MKNQQGGTGLGFVVGLLVGLGIALAVAVYVTKVPTPFVDRGFGNKAEKDAQEQERNKDWNPNAGLASKNLPTPRPAEELAPAPQAAPAVSAVEPGKPAPVPAARPAEKDSMAELIQSREATASPAPEVDPYLYFVQAGAFQSPAEAETQRAKLAMLGLDPRVSEREQAGQLVHRVRLGPFRSKAEAERIQQQLTAQGIKVALIRVQR
jgi:cell division protein FtsN